MAIEDKNIYSTFENTVLRDYLVSALKFRRLFSIKLYVNMHGVREWVDFYPFVESIRIPEVLIIIEKQG